MHNATLAINKSSRQTEKIHRELSRVIKEIELIHQNKFKQQNRPSSPDITQQLFNEAVQDPNEVEDEDKKTNWTNVKKTVDFIVP